MLLPVASALSLSCVSAAVSVLCFTQSEGLSGMQKFPTSLRQPDIQSAGERERGKKTGKKDRKKPKAKCCITVKFPLGFATILFLRRTCLWFLSLLLSFSFWLVSLWLREVIYYLAQSVAIIYINQSWWPRPEVPHRMSNGVNGLVSTGLRTVPMYFVFKSGIVICCYLYSLKPNLPIPWIKPHFLFNLHFAF